MTQSSSDKRVVVGQLAGVYGVKGWLKVRSYTEPTENILQYRPWLLRTAHGLKELAVEEYKIRPQGIVVHFRGLDDRDVAAQLGRALIEVEKESFAPLEDGEYYWHQLHGLKVLTEWDGEQRLLGRVKALMETGANDVLVVEPVAGSIDDRERLIPYVPDQFVSRVNLAEELLLVIWDPEF